MALKKTFLDSGVLLMAHRGKGAIQQRAIAILADPNREFVANQYIELEVIPKAVHFGHEKEHKFYRAYLSNAVEVVPSAKTLSDDALKLAIQHGLGACDALHAITALKTRVAEFVTTEGPTKPLLNIPGLVATSIADTPARVEPSRWQRTAKRAKTFLRQKRHELHVSWQKMTAAWRR